MCNPITTNAWGDREIVTEVNGMHLIWVLPPMEVERTYVKPIPIILPPKSTP